MNPEQKLFTNFLFLFLLVRSSTSSDTITASKSIKDGEVLVSEGQNFALGFFSPRNSSNRYVGIWYNKIPEHNIVWVANRDYPITNTSGVLFINNNGDLILHDQSQNLPVWSTNATLSPTNISTAAQLLDTGNLVLIETDTKRVIWQSFDYPTDTALPHMKIGLNRKTGLNRFLTSWKSLDDPGRGVYSYKIDPNGSGQFFIYKDSTPYWRTGPWDDYEWSRSPGRQIFSCNFVNDEDESYMSYSAINTSIFTRYMLHDSGLLQLLTWKNGDSQWSIFQSAPADRCDYYGQCGAYGQCSANDVNELECTCLPGYEPRSPRNWYLRDGSDGCMTKRAASSVCSGGEGFAKVAHAKAPDDIMALVDQSMSKKGCEKACLSNCSCVAYLFTEGSRCVTWYGDLMDTRVFSDRGQDLYIRVDALELAQYAKKSTAFLGKKKNLAIMVVAVVMLLLLISFTYWLAMKKRKGREKRPEFSITVEMGSTSFKDCLAGKELDESRRDPNLHLFDLSTIIAATENFSSGNKLGQGGFGSVYKGRLDNGQEIAVKRLSKNSGQGIEEFKNGVTLVAKLQHRNLVRLLGSCIHKEEKMLIYAFLSNRSLNFYIFDKTRTLLDWRKCYKIIVGIARGVLYLHQDSRLRIIHRDLKASNVLLDDEMNPKISDFGTARIFGGDQIEANTNRVVGTYGYMSPEYAMEGLYSTKSDIFSFGILLLEIISGRKNNGYHREGLSMNLIGHVWNLWSKGNALEILDSSLGESYPAHEVLRCIQIGLLCVQDCASDRPIMLTVVFMLGNEITLPSPKQPAFIFKRNNKGPDPAAVQATACSIDEETITTIEAR